MIRRTLRRARRRQRCTYRGAHCAGWIEPGDEYAEAWYSPSHEGITPPRWTRFTSCTACMAITGRPS